MRLGLLLCFGLGAGFVGANKEPNRTSGLEILTHFLGGRDADLLACDVNFDRFGEGVKELPPTAVVRVRPVGDEVGELVEGERRDGVLLEVDPGQLGAELADALSALFVLDCAVLRHSLHAPDAGVDAGALALGVEPRHLGLRGSLGQPVLGEAERGDGLRDLFV